jgi:hypothetical protein
VIPGVVFRALLKCYAVQNRSRLFCVSIWACLHDNEQLLCQDPTAPPPKLYRVCYKDDHAELMTAAEVLRHRVLNSTRIPRDTTDRLRSLGATALPPTSSDRVSVTNPTAMREVAPNEPAHPVTGASFIHSFIRN